MDVVSSPAVISEVQERYRRFAVVEAPPRSELYARWASEIAASDDFAAVLAVLPPPKRQPPLVFAVLRTLEDELGAPWQGWFVRERDRVVAACAAALLQSNEVNRSVPLALALSGIAGPVSLIELGASAGLCLFPDRYGYRFWREGELVAESPAVLGGGRYLDAELLGDDVPAVLVPEIISRTGADLAPIDLYDRRARLWLETLLWPGEDQRSARMSQAIEVALSEDFRMLRGDASEILAFLLAEPSSAVRVVNTAGLLVHLPYLARIALVRQLFAADAEWVSLDPPSLVLLDESHQRRCWGDVVGEHPDPAMFVLSRGGVALAWCDALGESVQLLPEGRFVLA